MRKTGVLLLATLSLLGCDQATGPVAKSENSGAPVLATPSASAVQSSRSAAPSSNAAARAGVASASAANDSLEAQPTIAEQDARAILTRWLNAQNDGKYESYEKLLAPEFTGVKRVGARAQAFERAGWLKDRKRFFAKDVTVTAADVRVEIAGKQATVRFVQTWEAGSFKDRGPKELILKPGPGGALQIIREAMLESEQLGSRAMRVFKDLKLRFPNGDIPESDCRKAVGFAGKIESCKLELLARGSAGALHVTTECGGDTCDYESFLFTKLETEPRKLKGVWLAAMELSPNHRYLWITNYNAMTSTIDSTQLDLTSGKSKPFSKCLSPRLAPGNKWYLCRNLKGDVLRVPLSGSKPKPGIKAGLPKGHQVKLGGGFHDYPEAVTFESSTRFSFTLYDGTDNQVLKRHGQWEEAAGQVR